MSKNSKKCLTAWVCGGLITGFLVTTVAGEEKKAGKPVAEVPSRRLSAGESQVVTRIKADPRLKTRFQGKDNPGDRETWFVIGFTDVAVAETKRTSANGIAGGFSYSPTRIDTQQKVVNNIVVVHGRTEAALAVMDYFSQPNQAAAKISVAGSENRPGGYTSRETRMGGDRNWTVRAFDNEGDARQFYDEMTQPKK